MLKLYGLKSCDTCRKARKWLSDRSHEHEFYDLREHGLDMRTLERWAQRLSWERLLNTRSLTWRKLPEVDRAHMTKTKALATMAEQPTLIKRPVLECDEFIAVGFAPAHYKKIFK